MGSLFSASKASHLLLALSLQHRKHRWDFPHVRDPKIDAQ